MTRLGSTVVVPLLTAALVAALVAGCAPAPSSSRPPEAPSPGTLAVVPDLVERLEPSVVTIFTGSGLGSGVVYRSDGIIVTNEHVVRGAPTVEVAFADGTRLPGTVRAGDVATDLALVQVPRTGLPVPRYATEAPRQGELAVVIGSPLGLENTVSTGIVSGVGRNVPGSSTRGSQPLVDLIQTSAPISPGNSGGALIDAEGQIIGLNEAYLPPASGAVAIGFAIPADRVGDVAEQLRVDGVADHPYLGASVRPLTEQLRRSLGVAAPRGVVVLDLAAGGPAAAAGLRYGDVITGLSGRAITDVADLQGALRSTRPGQQVPTTVQRASRTLSVTVTIGDAPR